MGRQMRPLDPKAGPVERFACELRALRAMAGDLPFWKMARRCTVSKSTLAAAVAGHQIPSELVVREFVRVCGGDWSAWRNRRLQAIAEAQDAAAEIPDAALRGAQVALLPAAPAVSRQLMPLPGRELAGNQADITFMPAGEPPRRRGKSRFWITLATAVVAAFAVGWAFEDIYNGPADHLGPPVRPVAAPAAATVLRDGQDPYVRGCGKDQVPINRQPIYRANGSLYGWVVLFVSARCSAAWGYVLGPNSPSWTVYIRDHRMSDNAQAVSSFRGHARPNSWGNALSTKTGCVRAEAWVDNGPHAVTDCVAPGGNVTRPASR